MREDSPQADVSCPAEGQRHVRVRLVHLQLLGARGQPFCLFRQPCCLLRQLDVALEAVFEVVGDGEFGGLDFGLPGCRGGLPGPLRLEALREESLRSGVPCLN
jgi:hypothetical protein